MPAALADEWDYLLAEAQRKNYTALQIYMMGQEYMAKIYQKEVLHFDYEKIQNHDKGFKSPVETEHQPKKVIQKVKVIDWIKKGKTLK